MGAQKSWEKFMTAVQGWVQFHIHLVKPKSEVKIYLWIEKCSQVFSSFPELTELKGHRLLSLYNAARVQGDEEIGTDTAMNYSVGVWPFETNGDTHTAVAVVEVWRLMQVRERGTYAAVAVV